MRDLAHTNPAAARAVLALYDRYRGLAPLDAAAGRCEFHPATEAISDFLHLSANHFPLLEAAAECIREQIDRTGDDYDVGARTYPAQCFLPRGLARLAAQRHLAADRGPHPAVAALRSGFARDAALSYRPADRSLAAGRQIEVIVAGADLLEAGAPVLGRNVLSAYFAAALIMPYPGFLKACRDYRYDI